MSIIRHTRSSLSASFETFSLPGGGGRRAAAAAVNPVPPRRSKACLRKRTAQGAGRARRRVPELGIPGVRAKRRNRLRGSSLREDGSAEQPGGNVEAGIQRKRRDSPQTPPPSRETHSLGRNRRCSAD